ncbi:MAG: YgiT-type zinc finger protein [Akkermansia sp.]
MKKNDIPCYECSSGVYQEQIMDYVFESEDGESITVPHISQLVCNQCGDVCVSMSSFDEIEEYVNAYYMFRFYSPKKSYLQSSESKQVVIQKSTHKRSSLVANPLPRRAAQFICSDDSWCDDSSFYQPSIPELAYA